MGDYIGDYYKILGVKTMAHITLDRDPLHKP